MTMNMQFDPRAWNLVAGVALVSAGCGARVASQEAGEEGETADTTPDSAEEPECVDSSDCPVGYGCYDGVCMYYPHHDGWVPYYDCYSDSECGEFYICDVGYCQGLPPSPDCEQLGLAWPAPTPIDVADVLALSFADVDADGQDEILVATPNQLLTFEDANGDPVASANTNLAIMDIVVGDFDGAPGEDVLLLIPDTLVLHASNGDGTFADPVENPLELGFVQALAAGDFDGVPPTDLLGWGGAGAFINLSGQVEIFDTSQINAGAVHEVGATEPGFALRRGSNVDLYTLDAQLLMGWGDVFGASSLAAFDRGFASQYVFVSVTHDEWSRVQSRGGAEPPDEWSIHGTPTHIFAGDLDGTNTDELVYVQDGANAYVHYNPREDGDCHEQLLTPEHGTPIDAAFGDQDGDGDQELALRTSIGQVVVFDGG